MNISCIRQIAFLAVLLVFELVYAQNDTEVLNENTFALRHGFTENYSVNFDVSNRAFVYTDNTTVYRLRQLQISHFSRLKLDLKQSIALGLMYRNRDAFEDSSNEVRLTQQYNRKSVLKSLRLGHRFRSEQRFYESFTAFRFRYRAAVDVPLQGQKLDVGETYLVVTNEALFTTTQIDKPSLEYRISPTLGILFSKDVNLEFGIELRLDQLNIRTEESIFLNTSLELQI